MKLQEIVHNLVLEAAISKAVYDKVYSLWSQENPNISRDDIQLIYDEFKNKQNGLSPNKAEVRSFLYRFDGNHGYSRFDPPNLRDITKYTYKQITSLLDEYKDSDNVVNDSVFQDKDTKPTKEKIEASKQLWNGSDYSIINEDGFRVYAIPNQSTSVKFGYYAELVNKKMRTGNPGGNVIWCVTWRPDMDNRTNMWGTYRDERTFYFVIDESKDINTDRYYMSALQKTTQNDTNSGFRLTSLLNDGDNPVTWESLVRIYPKLQPYKDLFVIKPYSRDELKEKNVVGQITESVNSRYEFKRVERSLKKAYINNHGILKKPDSWAHMDTGLRNLYILSSTAGDILEKFSSFEFLSEVKKVGNEFNLLNNRLKNLGFDGVSYIVDNIISKEFKIRRSSIDKPHLKIYQSKVNGKCGLYDTRKLDWVNFGGVTFTPDFSFNTGVDSFIDDDGNLFILEKYSNGGNSFNCVVPTDKKFKGRGYLLSQQKFEELQNDLNKKINLDLSKGPKIGNVNPETDTDLEEIKKGL